MDNYYSKNKRIAKNTIYLYFRMLFSLFISLFTSRVVLETLGVNDYGVYNVTGGIITMLSFLNGSMSGATSRFINYELSDNNFARLKIIFNSAMAVHVLIAVVVVILTETVGLWFLNNKLVIPKDSMYAAHWVFQMSILSAIFSITQVPYSATIMANEKMNVYAYLDMANSILRLVTVYLLVVINDNKLITYSILVAIVSIGMACTYRIYCLKKFPYARLSTKSIDINSVKSMLTFSGWDLYGNLSVMGRTQGVSMLANIFFGTVVNAAIGIANQVQSALNGFATNISLALKPQIIQSYASGDYSYMIQLLYRGSKLCFFIILLVALPILIETRFVLHVWLTTVPEYTLWICRYTLIFIFFSNMSFVMVTGVHATGNIKGPSLINGTMYLSVVPITYFTYKYGGSVYIPFILNFVFVMLGAIANCYYTKRYVKTLSVEFFVLRVILRCLIVTCIASILPMIFYIKMHDGWLRFIIICFSSILSTILFSYLLGFDNMERNFVKQYVRRFFNRH